MRAGGCVSDAPRFFSRRTIVAPARQDKRERKRSAQAPEALWGPTAVPHEETVDDVRARMTTSLGKSGHVNAFSTVFVKETLDAVAARCRLM